MIQFDSVLGRWSHDIKVCNMHTVHMYYTSLHKTDDAGVESGRTADMRQPSTRTMREIQGGPLNRSTIMTDNHEIVSLTYDFGADS